MTTLHLTSLDVQNYRLFKSLKLSNLKTVNIIGGKNGVGKTSLLEVVFHFMDFKSPITLFRPFDWRGIPLGIGVDNREALEQVFFGRDKRNTLSISADTNQGRYRLSFEFGPQVFAQMPVANLSSQDLAKAGGETTSASAAEGFTMIVKKNQVMISEFHVQVLAGGFQFQAVHQDSNENVPNCFFLNAATRRPTQDAAQRYTELVKAHKEDLISKFLALVHPEIRGIRLLAWGALTVIHADIGGENWIPLPFLGEGAVSLAGILLTMATAQGGVILLDEFDAAVHHSLLSNMWSLVFQAAEEFNVQVFATTHSENSLEAATAAAQKTNNTHKLHYSRLRKTKIGDVQAVEYSGPDLSSALQEDWEVR